MSTRHFADLDCTIVSPAPEGTGERLKGLYSSLFSTVDYFRWADHAPDFSVCTRNTPPHVVCFRRRGATIEVLNKVFDIDPASVRAICAALFRAYPGVLRIHIEVKTPPRGIEAPLRVLYWADDYVVEAREGIDAYTSGIGRTTRKHLRQYSNKLHREHPDFECSRRPGPTIDEHLLQILIGWNVERMERKGIRSVFVQEPDRAGYTLELAHSLGAATVCSIGGTPAAAYITFDIADETWVFAGAFDSSYEHLHLGLLAMHQTILDAVERGARRVHLLWGTTVYKERLGARPERAWRVSVYRRSCVRCLYLRELVGVIKHRWREYDPYWAARHALRHRLERAGLLPKRPDRP